MAGTDRTATALVAFFQTLEQEPHSYSFFQALRTLECLCPDRPRLGEAVRPVDEPIRLGQDPSLAFAPATLAGLQPAAGARPPRLLVWFLGLFGPNGPLPLHLTEYARERLRNAADPTLARFADIFHHRLLCLFYRGWANANPVVSLDRPDTDRFAAYVGTTFGVGTPALQHRDALPDVAKLHYAGLFAAQARPAASLRAMLADYFRVPTRIEEFAARWINLPPDCLCRLGDSPTTGTLGVNATVGDRVWDCAQTFRLVLGPVGWRQFARLLPGSESLRRLQAMVRNYIGDELAWDVQVILKKEEIPATSLGAAGQLGWTSWLAAATRDRDADDVVLNLAASATDTRA